MIPEITDSLGKYWDQPNKNEIAIDDKCAMMNKETLNQLLDYSCSTPTGVYAGKMWKMRQFVRRVFDGYRLSGGWILCWYGKHDNPKYVYYYYRKIIIIKEVEDENKR